MTFDDLKKTNAKTETTLTENSAVMYATTGKELVDMNFKVASYRNMSEASIASDFSKAYYENPIDAVRWLFFVRDIRGNGLGERRLFRVCMRWLVQFNPKFVINIVPHIAEFGRYDDIFSMLGHDKDVDDAIFTLIKTQIKEDVKNMEQNKSISLMAKWLPSINTSSFKTRELARYIVNGMHSSEKSYRKVLSSLRRYLDVVEVKISANEWEDVDYNTVPSQANLKYAYAFLKHDTERRYEYIQNLKSGSNRAKINANVLFPYEVVTAYMANCEWDYNHYGHYGYYIKNKDDVLEEIWKNLPSMNINKNILVVADGSGSMCSGVSGHTTALDVANSLAIYISEHNTGEFKNKYITFSDKPQFVDFTNAKSLFEKINIALEHDEIANTNIEKVFNLILNTAIDNNYTQDDMPENIVIISDMEFDMAIDKKVDTTLFDGLKESYNEAGYKMPKLVFWNVNSRTNGIPVQENELGVALVSGFSTTILNMVLSDRLDPAEILHEAIYNERYHIVEAIYGMD